MNYLSGVRLAVGLKLVTGLSVYTLNKLLIFSQAAHLAYAEGRPLPRARRTWHVHGMCVKRWKRKRGRSARQTNGYPE